MLVIALTGGIGSGKTTVTEILKKKNVPIIDTDSIAKDIVAINQPAYHKIIDEFGSSIVKENKELDRKALRDLIFQSEEKKMLLESILHPLIWQEVNASLASLKNKNIPYVIVVVPLLFESESIDVKFDRILVIDSPESLQVSRAAKRDNSPKEKIIEILNNQVSRQTRLNRADDIIVNENDSESLIRHVERLHKQYMQFAQTQ